MRLKQFWMGLLGCALLATATLDAAIAASTSSKKTTAKSQTQAKPQNSKAKDSKAAHANKASKSSASNKTAPTKASAKATSKAASQRTTKSVAGKASPHKTERVASKRGKQHVVAVSSKEARAVKVSYSRSGLRAISILEAQPAPSAEDAVEYDAQGNPMLHSLAFMVQDLNSGDVLLERNSSMVVPIASISKLMTSMVVLDANLSLTEDLIIGDEDVDRLKGTRSRLIVGTQFSREEMMRLALMSSENRAASVLSRYYPGGRPAFIAAMNQKAASLGLRDTRFYDSSGLDKRNVSSARDLAQMVAAASHYPLIRELTTTTEHVVEINGRTQTFHNTNSLVGSSEWQIGLSKTGFINESGKCLVMQAWFQNRPVAIVLMDSSGRFTRLGDANRVRKWMELTQNNPNRVATASNISVRN